MTSYQQVVYLLACFSNNVSYCLIFSSSIATCMFWCCKMENILHLLWTKMFSFFFSFVFGIL